MEYRSQRFSDSRGNWKIENKYVVNLILGKILAMPKSTPYGIELYIQVRF